MDAFTCSIQCRYAKEGGIMGISKTGCSSSITKEDLNNMYKQGFVEGYKKAQAGIDRVLERLEEKETELRKARHNLSFEMYTNPKAHEKAKVLTQKEITLHEAIEIVKEEVANGPQ